MLQKNGTTVISILGIGNADVKHGCKTAWKKRAQKTSLKATIGSHENVNNVKHSS